MVKAQRGEAIVRQGNELIQASKAFTAEDVGRSWRHVVVTLLVLALLQAITLMHVWWPVRLVASVVLGLSIVRMFVLYHDYLHNGILRRSKLAKAIMVPFGLWVLTPPNVWRQTHNYHHAHTAKIVGSHVGSYPMVTTAMWREMTVPQRMLYRFARHPMNIALGYVTIFLYGMCISSFVRNPRKNWDSLASVLLHALLTAGFILWFGVPGWIYGLVLPMVVACSSGAYLFYAQHNFEEVHVQPRHEWNYTDAALHSSSFMKLGPVMNWFTANIGYHHVHHLNPTIPFYRLPEAMAAIPELQAPRVTTLRWKDIRACFRLKLWDPEQGRMVGFQGV